MPRPIYRFGECTIDPSARELRNAGALATLSPKVFDVLTYLIEHRERAVGRDELIAAVWGKLDVSDTLLGQTVLKARRAVGDSGNGQNVIRTVPRFGYRWVADIRVEDGSHAIPVPREPQASAPAPIEASMDVSTARLDDLAAKRSASIHADPHTHRARRASLGVLIAVLVLGVGFAWLVRTRPHAPSIAAPAQAPSSETSAAVLPVAVEAGDEWTWLRLGLMDLIATRLRRAGQPVVPSDNVVALTHGDTAAGDDVVRAVRDATGARYIVVAKILHDANGWNADVELREPDGGQRVARAQGADPIDTARTAADRLLATLGMTTPADADGAAGLSLAELEQRTEAALLSDDLATARTLIEAAPPALRDTPIMRLRLGQTEFRAGQLASARTTLETLLDEAPAESDPLLRARALYALGAVSLRQDRNDDAMRSFGEAIALTASRNEPGVLGQAYTGLAAAEVNLGRFDAAADDLGRARVALVLAGDALALARVDANEGVLDNARGRHAEALPILHRAAERFRQFGALNDLFLTVAAEMKAHLALLDAAAALTVSEPVWAMRSKLANPVSRTSFELQRARALAASGRLTDARALLEEIGGVSSPQQTGLPGDIASESAHVYMLSGLPQPAADAARIAVERLPTTDEARERARAWLTLCRALRAAGRLDDARDQVGEFSRWSSTHAAMPSVTLFAALASAEQARAERRNDDASRSYDTALGDAERWAVPADLATVAVSYAGSLIADSDFERASAVIGRVARWADRDFDCALLQARLYHALGERATWEAALARARALAGERKIPVSIESPPRASPLGASS